MGFLKRRDSSSSPEGVSGSFAATVEDAARFPAVLEFMTAVAWPDGEPRTLGSLTLFCEEGRLKLCVSDKANGAVAFVTGNTLLEVLDAAERLLVGGGGDWRPTRENGRAGRRK